MKKCIACGRSPVEWQHSLIYSGRQLNEPYSIQPLCLECHRGNNGTIDQYAKMVSELAAITMGLRDLQKKYPKFDWLQRKKALETKILYDRHST